MPMEQSLSASSIALLLAREEKKRNWTIAVVMLMLVSVLATVSSQLSNKAFTDSSMKHCMDVVGGEWTCKSATVTFVPSAITLLLAQIGWILGLANLPVSIATAILSFAGIGLNAYGQLEHDMNRSSVIGISATVVAAFANALHLLAFKKAFPQLDLGQTSFVVSCLFLFNCLMLWPVPLVLELTRMESFDTNLMPWPILMGAWICSSLAAVATGYGLVVSTPFFMSIAELLILMANSVVDVMIRQVKTHLAQIIGIALIGVAFIVLVVPDEYMTMGRRKSKASASSSPSRPSAAASDEEGSSKHSNDTNGFKDERNLKPPAAKVRRAKSDQNVPGNESIATPRY
ncbi:hypothetical protein RvY_14061 [Ramazzottius varieornatus]|uniref:EamA domain-containing protein n=1 Tax=Ramazzottius varieornatus TaxID=947166 RepID=A0A1D1VQ12_RAMVA|nr:hypothetical protein RvY_14061 [Ramazzottius varieornatus]